MILAISSLFSIITLIVFSALRNSAFSHDFSRTDLNSQKMQYPVQIIEKIGKGITTQHNRSMKHNSMNGVKYFFALTAVFLYPVDVLASPRCLAFITPVIRSTNIAPIVAAIHKAISTICIIMCSLIKL